MSLKRSICILTALFILTGCSSYLPLLGVTRLNKDRKQITRSINKKNNLTATVSTLTFQPDTTKFRPATWTYHFDRNGKCDWIVTTFDCEKCYLEDLTPIITSKLYRWEQSDSLTYITKRYKAELHKRYQNNPYSYIIKRIGN